MGKVLHEVDEQSIGFIAVARGNQPRALREVVLTKIHDWNGANLGALAVGFPIGDLQASNLEGSNAIKSGLWLDQRLYIDALTGLDRKLVMQRIGAAVREGKRDPFVLDLEEGRRIANTLRTTDKAVILQNHGLLTVGASVEEAAWHFISMDRSCHAQLLAEAAGTPRLIRHEVAEPLGQIRGYGGFSFQPYWDLIVAEQPDLLE